MAQTFANVFFLVAHVAVQPYTQRQMNHIESVALSLLVLESAMLTRFAAPYDNNVQLGLFFLIVLPAIIIVLIMVALRVRARGKSDSASKQDTIANDDGVVYSGFGESAAGNRAADVTISAESGSVEMEKPAALDA